MSSRLLPLADYVLIPFKIVLLLCLLIWGGFWIAHVIAPHSFLIKNIVDILDHTLFWGVIIILLMIAFVFLLNYRRHIGYALLYPFLDQKSKKITGYDICIPRFYTSLMLWLMIYIIVLSMLAIISKLTNRHYVLFAF